MVEKMQEYDLLVIGSGAGLNVASQAARAGLKAAIFENGPLGGTCLNRGCIPSKMLIFPAEVAEIIKGASKFGIKAKYNGIDFKALVKRVNGHIDGSSKRIETALKGKENPKLVQGTAKFTGERTIECNGQTFRGKYVLIAAGAKPFIPPIKGLEETPYITSTEALRMDKLPNSMAVIGGGYIAAELSFFFGALGTKITVIERNDVLLSREDSEISAAFTNAFSKKFDVRTGQEVTKVEYKGKEFTVFHKGKDGKEKKVKSEQLLVAVGVIPNSDLLEVKKAGIETDARGFIKVNGFLETSAKNVWALGDILGKFMFRHSANHEAAYAAENIINGSRIAVDYTAMPHAVFSSPQIAGVGKTEQ